MEKLGKDEWLVLKWLSREDVSAYGECQGKELDKLVELGIAEVEPYGLGLAEGYDVTGYDIEEHAYGDMRYQGTLVLQDVCTLHGAQFKDVDLIVASPPCQEYSYMAMPWSLAKAKAAAIRADTTGEKLAALNRLFNECFRIQREASFAAGRHIPLVVENVKGAQPWVGRARWNYGSFFLWGDVPALMPLTSARKLQGFPVHELSADGIKGSDGYDRNHPNAFGWKKPRTSSNSTARKAASAKIAMIPLPLSRHIAVSYRP